ncbi:MAG TPA: ATP phosphoribosyltransferase [Spirochaetales bacterium]|nr:ATP phosphoribosyltransferase [Spirochaetales bacterium]
METGTKLRIGLPKGRMQEAVLALLAEAGLAVRLGERDYRPMVAGGGFDAKLLKSQNIVEMLATGTRDLGFTGADWVRELGADLVEVLDTGFDPVTLVAAAPAASLGPGGELPRRALVVASEYEGLSRAWIAERGLEAVFVRSYGATEAFPPEDADVIIDNVATGSTLRANRLAVVDELMRSTTRLYASREAMADPEKARGVERVALLCRSVLAARGRVMLEVNVGSDALDAVVAALPCMREPTVSALRGGGGWAVKVAAPREALPTLIQEIRARGGTDIVVTEPSWIVP